MGGEVGGERNRSIPVLFMHFQPLFALGCFTCFRVELSVYPGVFIWIVFRQNDTVQCTLCNVDCNMSQCLLMILY